LNKKIKIVLIVVFIFIFVVGVWYPVTRYSFEYNSGKRGHRAIAFGAEEVLSSPEDFESPLSIFYFWESVERSLQAPWLSLLINKKYERFYIYSIEYIYKGGNFKKDINQEYIIDYDNDVVINGSWIYVGLPFLEEINFGKYFSKIKLKKVEKVYNFDVYETFDLITKVTYKFDNEEIQTEEINYKVTKSRRLENFSPLGYILMIFVYI
jgi:hypothetical protein